MTPENARGVTLADGLRAAVISPNISQAQLRDIKCAARTVTRILMGRDATPEQLPLTPTKFRPHWRKILPARHRISRKRWANLKSHMRTLAILLGLHAPRQNRDAPLQEPWSELYRTLQSRFARLSIRSFLRFCIDRGLHPHEVNNDTAVAYEHHLIERTFEMDPYHTARGAICAWNKFARLVPGWPQQQLVMPQRVKRIMRPLAEFPPSFAADLRAYLETLNSPPPFGQGARRRPLSPRTIDTRRQFIMRAASILTIKGTSIESIVDLGALASPAAFRQYWSTHTCGSGDVGKATVSTCQLRSSKLLATMSVCRSKTYV